MITLAPPERWKGGRLLAVVVSSCLACEIEIDECGRKQSRKACENAEVDSIGHCYWVEVSTQRIADGDCERIESHGECVGIVGTQAGCAPSCPDDEFVNAFFRIDGDDEVELFENPECGPTPVDDWTACSSDDVPECGCLCGSE